MDNLDNLKALLFDTVMLRLCDLMIEECAGDEITEFFVQLTEIAKQNSHDPKLVAFACRPGLLKIFEESEANKNTKRQFTGPEVNRVSMRFLSFYYMLAQIRPKELEANEDWAFHVAKINKKGRKEVGSFLMQLFLLQLPERELVKVFKGDELKHFKKWKKAITS